MIKITYCSAVLGAFAFVLGGDGLQLLIFFLVAPILLLCCLLLVVLVAVSRRRHHYAWLLGGIVFFFASVVSMVALQRNDPYSLRSTVRWWLRAKHYKAEVLAERKAGNEGLAHIVWDEFGFLPAGSTLIYLVYDPSNSLAAAAHQGGTLKLPNLACNVDRVHRLESHWYAVLFPTDSDWRECSNNPPQ